MQPDPALRLPAVMALTGKSQSQIYAEIAEGKFPKQFRIGKRAVAWRQSEVMAHIADLVKASREPTKSCSKQLEAA